MGGLGLVHFLMGLTHYLLKTITKKLRMTVNYHALNKQTINNCYLLSPSEFLSIN